MPVPGAPTPAASPAVLRWLRSRLPITEAQAAALEASAAQQAFTVAGLTSANVVADVLAALDQAVTDGTGLEEFRASVGASLTSAWGRDGGRVATVFRTGLATAHNAGRYAEATEPDTLALRPFWRFSATVDARTAPQCKAAHGTLLPASDAWWQTHYPPLHFNALAAGTLILTAQGERPIEDIRPGHMVLTHRARWRRVYATMRKRESKVVRTLHLASGRSLRVTHEHPVLTATPGGLAWRKAGDLKPGDQVVQHRDQVGGAPDGPLADPSHAPPLLDEPGIAGEVVSFAGGRPVPLPVDFQVNPMLNKGQVEHVRTYRVLRDTLGEQGADVALFPGHVGAGGLGEAGGGFGPSLGVSHGVALAHPLGGIRLSGAPGPVGLAAALGDHFGLSVGDARLGGLGADGDAVSDAPLRQHAVAYVEFSLDGSDALVRPPVLLADEAFDDGLVRQVNGHFFTVITTVEDATEEADLFDLSVEDDETYTAAGVVVHNCRCIVQTLSRRQAEREGGPTAPGALPAADGFGSPPT